jgi:hypothetical protein
MLDARCYMTIVSMEHRDVPVSDRWLGLFFYSVLMPVLILMIMLLSICCGVARSH